MFKQTDLYPNQFLLPLRCLLQQKILHPNSVGPKYGTEITEMKGIGKSLNFQLHVHEFAFSDFFKLQNMTNCHCVFSIKTQN